MNDLCVMWLLTIHLPDTSFHSYRQPSDFLHSACATCCKLQSCEAVVLQSASLAHSVSVIHSAHDKNPKKLQCAESVALAGEFEPHANAWMGWPDSGMLWREDAKPAQKQYADVAKAISQFEPVVMMANPEVRTLLQVLIPTVLASCTVTSTLHRWSAVHACMPSKLEFARRLLHLLSPVGTCLFLELPKVSNEECMRSEHNRTSQGNTTQFQQF